MYRYRPPFDDSHVIALGRQRGLIQGDETLVDALVRVAAQLSAIDAAMADSDDSFPGRLRAALLSGRVGVSSQLLASAGRSTAVAACTVLPVSGDTDARRMGRLIVDTSGASAAGMGCGVDLTTFTDPVKALAVLDAEMRILHTSLIAANRRPPAIMATCSGDHPRITEFIDAKRYADFDGYVANISVLLSGDDAQWRRLRPLLAAAAYRNGEPGVLFQDNADADNPTPDIAISSTAPCAEVFMAPGERCVFLTVNVAAHVIDGRFDASEFARSVELAVRAGDAAVQLAADHAPPIVAARRRIGVGVCGYHSALITLGIPYAHSVPFARRLSELLTFHAHGASAELAVHRGPFPLCDGSRWREPTWLRRKAHRQTGAIPTGDWSALWSKIMKTGIRNAAIVAYPPTGVIAELLGVSRSYEPYYTLVGRAGMVSNAIPAIPPEVSSELSSGRYPAEAGSMITGGGHGHQLPGRADDDVLACARQLAPAVHLAVHAAFSHLADDAGSKTVNLPGDVTVDDVAKLFDTARNQQLKGLTVFRDGCLSQPASI